MTVTIKETLTTEGPGCLYPAAKAATAPMTITAGECSSGAGPEPATLERLVNTARWLGKRQVLHTHRARGHPSPGRYAGRWVLHGQRPPEPL